MVVSSINIEKIYNLNKIPENIVKYLLVYIFFYIIIFVILFVMKCYSEYTEKSNKYSNQNKLETVLSMLANYIADLMFKMIVFATYLFILIVIFFVAMNFIFAITTDVIVTLYNSIGVDNLDLFKTLVGPVITVLVLSLSVLGSILSKSLLKRCFDYINNEIERFPEYLNRMSAFFIEHIKLACILGITAIIIIIAIILAIF